MVARGSADVGGAVAVAAGVDDKVVGSGVRVDWSDVTAGGLV